MVRVSIIGCGLLGVKIAGEFAYHGHRVKCYDNNIQALNSVYARYQSDKAQLYADRVVESPNFTGQVLCLSRLEETVNDAQLIIECVIEDFDVKSVLLEKISSLCPTDAIIATNTLRLDINKLADKIKHKERFVGLRFLYPVYYISEVEFTPHKDTANWVVEKLRTLLGQMGKTLFFRSGSDPLILSEEKREMRKQQRAEELRISNGLPLIRQDTNVPELSRNIQTDLQRLFLRRANNQQDFFSLNAILNESNANKDSNKKNANSVPDFPAVNNNQFDTIIPENNRIYGQSFLCMSLDGAALETIADGLLLENIEIYHQDFSSSKLKKTSALAAGNNIKNPSSDVINFKTAVKGLSVTGFFKNAYDTSITIYEDVIVPGLKTSLFVESWGRPYMASDCSLSGGRFTKNILSIKVAGDSYGIWENTQDHSKWAISASNSLPFVCLGDMNRQSSQSKRGGGAFCIKNAGMWAAFNSIIDQFEDCSSTRSFLE